jgi:hypothetical protein
MNSPIYSDILILLQTEQLHHTSIRVYQKSLTRQEPNNDTTDADFLKRHSYYDKCKTSIVVTLTEIYSPLKYIRFQRC